MPPFTWFRVKYGSAQFKVIAIKTRQPWNENKELIAQGLAKVAAAFCHSMPVGGSFSRSALNLASQARTGLSSAIAASRTPCCNWNGTIPS